MINSFFKFSITTFFFLASFNVISQTSLTEKQILQKYPYSEKAIICDRDAELDFYEEKFRKIVAERSFIKTDNTFVYTPNTYKSLDHTHIEEDIIPDYCDEHILRYRYSLSNAVNCQINAITESTVHKLFSSESNSEIATINKRKVYYKDESNGVSDIGSSLISSSKFKLNKIKNLNYIELKYINTAGQEFIQAYASYQSGLIKYLPIEFLDIGDDYDNSNDQANFSFKKTGVKYKVICRK